MTDAKVKGHTPLPWRNDGGIYANDKCCAFLVGGKDGAHPTIFIESKVGSQKERQQFEANVELIELAVNAYPALSDAVKALEGLTTGIRLTIADGLARRAEKANTTPELNAIRDENEQVLEAFKAIDAALSTIKDQNNAG